MPRGAVMELYEQANRLLSEDERAELIRMLRGDRLQWSLATALETAKESAPREPSLSDEEIDAEVQAVRQEMYDQGRHRL